MPPRRLSPRRGLSADGDEDPSAEPGDTGYQVWSAASRAGGCGLQSRADRRHPPASRSPIDIIFLIERLEALIANGRRMPMTNSVVVDQVAALDLVDQLRVAVPEEVRQAKRINEETTRLVERAQEEAERILARAQEQAAFLIEERELTRAAEIRSQQVVAQGHADADEIRRGADQYAATVLIRLEGECVRALQSIRHGITMLDERHPDEPAPAPALEPPGPPELDIPQTGARVHA